MPRFSRHCRPSSWHLFLSARSSAATEWPACLQGLFLPAFPAAMLFLSRGLSHHFVFPSPLRLPVATTRWPVSQVSTLVSHYAFPLQAPPPLSGAHISPHMVSCLPLSASEHPHIPPCLPTASSSAMSFLLPWTEFPQFSSVQLSRSVVSNSLPPHGL